MQQLLGEKADMIPAVSFRYTLQNETLTMYFDEAYVRTIYVCILAVMFILFAEMTSMPWK